MDRVGVRCIKCNEMQNQIKLKHIEKKHNQKRCTNCGKEMDRDGWICLMCCEKSKIVSKIRAQERRERSECVQCGTPITEHKYCDRCRELRRNRYWQRKFKEE
jgi:hypothetical protein